MQHIEAGDFIESAPQDWLGGRYAGKTGWRVTRVDPGRALVLEGWGSFVVEPVDERTSRLIARTRGRPNLLMSVLAEVPHFIMERGMLLGIKRRAEALAAGRGQARSAAAGR